MKRIVRFGLAAMLLAFGTLVVKDRAVAGKPVPPPPPPPMPVGYLVTWLRAPDGVSNTQATGSNSSGMVAGHYGAVNNEHQSRACIWTADGNVFPLHDLAVVPEGWVLVTARGINDAGQIAGSAVRLADGLVRVYRFDPATDTAPAQVTLMGDLTSTASHSIAYTRPINNLGDVAYATMLPDGTYCDVVQTLDGSMFQAIGPDGQYFKSISDARQLVGGNRRWTLSTGQVEEFSTSITGVDINVHGHFAGRMYTNGRTFKAMRYQSSAQAIGPKSSFAYGINSSGDVVGYVNDTGGGFLFTDEYGYVDLDTLVVGDASDLALWNSATSIQPWKVTNRASGEFGDITGTASFDAVVSLAFLLTPIPAPAP